MSALTHRIAREGAALNTHHLVKLFALLVMTIDHVGAYLEPHDLWWRVIGRMGFPVWFFLVGYARQYRVSYDLILWAVAMALINPFLGEPFFPLNALVTIIACRYLLQYIDRRQLVTRQPVLLCFLCILFLLETYPLMEYGTLGLLYALMGYAVQHGHMTWRSGKLVALTALIAFLLMMQFVFKFDAPQLLVMIAATSLVTYYLSVFVHRPVRFAADAHRTRSFIVWWSRHSMQYYVIHRLLFQAAAVMRGILTVGLRLF